MVTVTVMHNNRQNSYKFKIKILVKNTLTTRSPPKVFDTKLSLKLYIYNLPDY